MSEHHELRILVQSCDEGECVGASPLIEAEGGTRDFLVGVLIDQSVSREMFERLRDNRVLRSKCSDDVLRDDYRVSAEGAVVDISPRPRAHIGDHSIIDVRSRARHKLLPLGEHPRCFFHWSPAQFPRAGLPVPWDSGDRRTLLVHRHQKVVLLPLLNSIHKTSNSLVASLKVSLQQQETCDGSVLNEGAKVLWVHPSERDHQ